MAEDFASCQLCLCYFDEKTHAPLLLICGHSFCAECSVKLSAPLCCPLCRSVTPGLPSELRKNFALLDVLPRLFPPISPPEICVECGEVDAVLFCAPCGALCQACSTQIHRPKVLSSHISVIVPISAKATASIVLCADHGEKALLYCPSDSSAICFLCRDYGKHKGHADVLPIPDACKNIVTDLREVVAQTEDLQKLASHNQAIVNAQESVIAQATRARSMAQAYFAAGHKMLEESERDILAMIETEEVKMTQALNSQRFELASACSKLQAIAATAVQLCQQSQSQILQAPKVELPSIFVLSQACFSDPTFRLNLPTLQKPTGTLCVNSCTNKARLEEVCDQGLAKKAALKKAALEKAALKKAPLEKAALEKAPLEKARRNMILLKPQKLIDKEFEASSFH